MGNREVDAFLDQASPDAEASCRGLYEEKPELSDLVRFVDEKYAADSQSLALSNPAALSIGIEIPDEIPGDFLDEILEPVIPSVFIGVDIAMTPYHPLDVVVTMLTKSKGIRHLEKFARVRAIREY
jgi:hypothetical protein